MTKKRPYSMDRNLWHLSHEGHDLEDPWNEPKNDLYMICVPPRASQGYGTVVRNALFAHINSLSHREIDRLGTASLVTRMTNDVNQLQLAVAMLIRLVVRAPFLAVGATVMAMTLDFKLSLIFVIAFVAIAVILYGIMSRSVPYYQKIQRLLDRVSAITRGQ